MEKWIERLRTFAPAFLLLALVCVVYSPVIAHGGFIWDDPDYIVHNQTLRDVSGLVRMWVHPTSLPQYYPVVHTTFWIEYQLWQLNPAGYHVDNILLHALAAILLWRILRRLEIPGALLAAAIFAVHPVMVESVAWATERKNVLSLVFYLLALRAYLIFDEKSQARSYVAAMVFFVLALLSKSVTCSLPAAILLIVYYQRGSINRRDIRRLSLFFVLGLVMALVTGMIEREHVGAAGREFQWTFAQRSAIAGRALWFYGFKLIWPAKLTFIYPKWTDLGLGQVYWPVTAILVAVALFLLRKRIERGPLVAVLFFGGTLLPALGFINLYPMRYSYVADHFQYQASIGLIVLFSALVAVALHRQCKIIWPVGAVLVAILSVLTWRQCWIYRNPITLWQDTVEKNPTSYMAWGNLGSEWAELSNQPNISREEMAHDREQAIAAFHRLIDLAPDQPLAHWKWGIVHEFQGDLPAALDDFNAAIKVDPTFTPAMNSAGLLLMQMHRPAEAMEFYRRAIALEPKYAEPHYNLGVALEQAGDIDSAIQRYAAATGKPDYADPDFNLGNIYLLKKNRPDLAAFYYALAIEADPERADIRVNYASTLKVLGNVDAARQQCAEALRLNPNLVPARQLWSALNPGF